MCQAAAGKCRRPRVEREEFGEKGEKRRVKGEGRREKGEGRSVNGEG